MGDRNGGRAGDFLVGRGFGFSGEVLGRGGDRRAFLAGGVVSLVSDGATPFESSVVTSSGLI